ncbi:MAG: hypothetical protein ACRDRG_18315 [Pseudonocardiaceae bacterium]
MTQEPQSHTKKARLDDLLTTMGITPDQMKGMTAEDLFAAATQWQKVATIAAAEAKGADRLSDSLQVGRRV